MGRQRALARVVILAAVVFGRASIGHAQALETETARFLDRGQFEVGSALEWQTSAEGGERAVPTALEYGISDRIAVLVEPVVYTAIRPKRGARATGVGDLELTGFLLLRRESSLIPALAVAGELKLPTTHDPLIGTGRTDATIYVIASRLLSSVDLHLNAGYAYNGSPPGTHLQGTFTAAFAAELLLTKRFEVFGEALGTTASAPEGGGDNLAIAGTVAPEAAGGELVGTVGVGLRPSPGTLLSLSVSYDNNNAVLVRPGVTIRTW